jgi:hypothetical protein
MTRRAATPAELDFRSTFYWFFLGFYLPYSRIVPSASPMLFFEMHL